MNCRAAEGMVNRYINHTLNIDELEEFLEHISTCSSCYDELETYFIVHEAMQQLDEEQEETAFDLKQLLEQDIKKSRRYIRKKKASRFFAGFFVCVLIGLLAAFLIYIFWEFKHTL